MLVLEHDRTLIVRNRAIVFPRFFVNLSQHRPTVMLAGVDSHGVIEVFRSRPHFLLDQVRVSSQTMPGRVAPQRGRFVLKDRKTTIWFSVAQFCCGNDVNRSDVARIS